jgi:uncharacterized caspase-like protein
MKKWAIAIGINQYQFFQPLSYAQQDAQALKAFLVNEAGFAPDRCILLSDTSPPIWGKPTDPSYENIQSWLDLLTQQYLQPGDLLWLFFSGCGVCWQGKDYLVPIAGNPADLPGTAISLENIFNRLKGISAETLLVLLDMTRSEGSLSHEAIGAQTAELASHLEIPTILACQPGQFSRESSFLGHGFLTAALLEGLRHPSDVTLASLDRYLKDRVPQLSEHYLRPLQQPLTISPSHKIHQPVLPTQTMASFTDRDSVHVGAVQESRPIQVHTAQPEGEPAPVYAPPTPQAGAEIGPTDPGPEALVTEDSLLGRSLWWGGVAVATFLLASGVFWRNWAPMTQGSHFVRKSTPDTGSQIASSSAKSQVVAAQTASPTEPQRPLTTSANAIAAQSAQSNFPVQHSVTAPIQNLAHFSTLQPVTQSSGAASSAVAPFSARSIDGSDDSRPASFPIPKTQFSTNRSASKTRSQPKNSLLTKSGTAPAQSNRAGQKNKSSQSKSAQPATGKPLSTQSMLDSARGKIALNSNQASPYWYAIRDASKIKPTDPQYQEAQQAIADWSQDILTIANRRASQRSFDTAIMAASLIPSGQLIHTEAQQAIDRWCPSLSRQSKNNPARRQQAKAICMQR